MKRFSLLVLVATVVFASPLALAQPAPEAVITPAENLVVEGIPKIPQALAEEIGRYTEFRGADFTSWSPTGREMLIITRFGDTAQIHLVKMPGGARRQQTFFKERVGGGEFLPNGESFLFTKDVGGNEQFQIYRQDLATGDATLLTDGKSRNTGAQVSHSGHRIAYGSTQRTGNDVDVWTVSPGDTKSAKLLAQLTGGGWDVAGWSPDDKQLLVVEGISANESYVWLMNAETGEKTLLTPKGGKEKVSYTNAKFARDGKSVYVTSDLDSEFLRLARIDLATKARTVLTSHIPWDIEELEFSPDGKLVAFVANEDGLGVLHLMDLTTGKEKSLPKMPRGIVSGVRFHKNGKDLAFSLQSNREGGDAWSLDVTTNALDRWTYSETAGLNTATFAEPETVKWKSFDGRSISGVLYRPPASFSGKRPVVIDIHGGPEDQFRPYSFGSYNFYLNKLGVAMVFPNVRGSSGFGKTFLTLDNGFLREDSYKDILSLLDWIKTQPALDADRVMVTGGSYGGFMTLAVATNYNDRIRCSLDVVGPSNLVTFLKNTSGYRVDLRRVEYGDERDPKMHDFLEKIAPANNAGKITKPLFVVQGLNDPRVPASESVQMVATVRKNGTPVWYLAAKDEGHGFRKKSNRDFLTYARTLFMKEFLLK